ncbi:S4 domain-containing protein, partial [Bacillus sp. SIMBA_008]
MNQVNIAVSEEQTSERLDKFLSTTEPEWSRTQVQQWVKDGLIEVNGKQVKANYKVQAGDQIKVE